MLRAMVNFRYWNGVNYSFCNIVDGHDLSNVSHIDLQLIVDSNSKFIYENDFVEIEGRLAKVEHSNVLGTSFRYSEKSLIDYDTALDLGRRDAEFFVIGNPRHNPELEEAWRNGSYNKQPN